MVLLYFKAQKEPFPNVHTDPLDLLHKIFKMNDTWGSVNGKKIGRTGKIRGLKNCGIEELGN